MVGCSYRPARLARREISIVVFGGQEYEMLAATVALTKSGHAYIPSIAIQP